MSTITSVESNVRHYSRMWPTVFTTGHGTVLEDTTGRRYLDFFAAAGTLNYGHNPAAIRSALIEYLESGGPISSLDMWTEARERFIETISTKVLATRGLTRYRIQFTSPSGAAAVEAALRLARKATNRRRIVTLSGSFHGVTLDASAASDSAPPGGRPTLDPAEYTKATFQVDDLEATNVALEQAVASAEPPAAILLELIQGEGGVRPVDFEVAHTAAALAKDSGAVLILDEVQAGCGRTGPFLSFETAAIVPDMVCLSKSIGGGLPLALVLIREDLDVWEPGEHSGTFRGSNLSFVAGEAALRTWWKDAALADEVARKEALLRGLLAKANIGPTRGRGLMLGIPCPDGATARRVSTAAFKRGLLVETCGPGGEVIKLLPPLTVLDEELCASVEMLADAFATSDFRHQHAR